MPTALTTIAAILMTASVSAPGPDRLDLGFDDGLADWRVVLDGVMGGRSTGRIDAPTRGVLRFAGELSLENNGGFAQMRSPVPAASFVDAVGVELVVRGDGRTYRFDIRCSNARVPAGSYQQAFATDAGVWKTIRLPLDGFRLYSFGREIPGAPKLDPALVESIGVTLADKSPGAFEIEIDSIRATGAHGASAQSLATRLRGERLGSVLDRANAPLPAGDLASMLRADRLDAIVERLDRTVREDRLPAPRSAEAGRLLELAISRGVPLFNAGQEAACASIYEVAIEAVLTLGADGLAPEIALGLERALDHASTQHRWSDRAWTYRRAMDDAHARLLLTGEHRAAASDGVLAASGTAR